MSTSPPVARPTETVGSTPRSGCARGFASTSVVICAYADERWDLLLAAAASARRQQVPPIEIIVCVDHNPSLEGRLREALPDAVIVANSGPRGLSAARNTAVGLAQGEVVAFLDDDAVAPPDWIEGLVAPFEDETVTATGTAARPHWEVGRPRWWPEEFDWVVGCTYRGLPETETDVRNVIGCSMAIRRTAFERVGLFSHSIGRVGNRPIGCEETEFCIRLAASIEGARVLYLPKIRVDHYVPATRATFSYFVARCYSEGVSKAIVARLAGATAALSSERDYVRRTLVRGVMRGLGANVGGDRAGGLRAGAIATGLVVTAAGYAYTELAHRLGLVREGPPALSAA